MPTSVHHEPKTLIDDMYVTQKFLNKHNGWVI